MTHTTGSFTESPNTIFHLGPKPAFRRPQNSKPKAIPAAPVPHSHLLGRGNVLLVEDDPDVLSFATAAVRSFGYTVYPAKNAEEALAVFENELPVDVLFCDIRLPGTMNGVALAHAAKKINPGVEVLMTSGYSQGTYLKLLGYNGEMDFIPKPYPVSALREKLDTLNSNHRRFS